MKFLLVLTVVLVAIWIWRNNRRIDTTQEERKRPAQARPPMPMIACLHCGTHLPESESVKGPHGRYCSAEHRALHERQGS